MPTAFRLRQVILDLPAGPVTRVQRSMLMSLVGSTANVRERVQQHGIRSLGLEIPVGRETHVRVRVYTLSGVFVREIVNDDLLAGSYVVGWDGNDAGGRKAQPGVYVALMEAGEFREIQRLIVR
jgi:flagellar hook assembly protein FlgD